MSYPDVIVITGTSSGLGKELALHYINKDVKVIGISRTESNIIHKNFKEIIQDISYFYEAEELLYGVFDNLNYASRVGVILSAGTLGDAGGLEDSNLIDWEQTFSTNVLGNLAILKGVLPYMIASKFGRIIIVAGGGAAYHYEKFSGYSLSKVALVREAENLSYELRGKGDFCTVALAPGAMNTPMLAQVKSAGATVMTVVDISEPIEFTDKFMCLENDNKILNGRFMHSRDALGFTDVHPPEKYFLRRIE